MSQRKKRFIKIFTAVALTVIMLVYIDGCSGNRIQTRIQDPSELKPGYYLDSNTVTKLHMKNGDVYVMKRWHSDTSKIMGSGYLYDFNRDLIKTAEFEVPFKDIVLAETNSVKASENTALMMVPTVVTGIVAAICAANPKACFGSCPTFYINDGKDYVIQAEGFSAAVSKSLEEEDVDALYHFSARERSFELQLRNEAYETHFIREADILALPKSQGNRVFAVDNRRFFEVNNLLPPESIQGPEGDCSEMHCRYDGEERLSEADSADLAEKEIIDLAFDNALPGKKGLIIASRQSLLMTYIFYQGLAYMGSSAPEYFAQLERDTTYWKNIMRDVRRSFGGIEVSVSYDGISWEQIGETGEFGPIASDIKILPFVITDHAGSIKMRLRMTKGFWRIDYIALADIIKEVKPITIRPSDAYPLKDKKSSSIVNLLNNDDSLLVTFPGDKYFLHYELPENPSGYDYFLNTRGYYTEWIREEWIKEENPTMVYEMFFNHKQFFKDLAPGYKILEPGMEESFRSSKYVMP